MNTTDTNDTPKRRLEDRQQPATITNDQITAGAAVLGDDGKPVGRNTAIMVWEAMGGMQAAPPAIPEDRIKLRDEALSAARSFADAEFEHARNIGKGGPGIESKVRKAEDRATKAICALAGAASPAAPEQDQAIAEESAPEVQLVPKWAGQFDSHQDWVNRAQRALSVPSHKPSAVCVDAKGRRCFIGADMARAHKEGAFPVRYFWECKLAATPAAHIASKPNAEPVAWMVMENGKRAYVSCNKSGAEGSLEYGAGRSIVELFDHPAATPAASTPTVPEGWREQLYTAAINCGHSIDENKIVLHRDKRKEGNALSQLGDRLAAAIPVAPAASTDAVIEARAQDNLDAERYRWLRNADPEIPRDLDVVDDNMNIVEGKTLDAALDELMRTQATKGE